MPHPYVKSATISANLVELTVELDSADSGSYVEVSGSATQTSGAFANFYGIEEVASGLTGPSGPHPTVSVSAQPLPPNNFRKDEDITFVIRVAKVWLTVLGPQGAAPVTTGTSLPAVEGTTWDVLRSVAQISDGSPDDPYNPPPPGAGQS